VQEAAMQAWETGKDFREIVRSDARIAAALSAAELAAAFDLDRQLRHVDAIFARVFAS